MRRLLLILSVLACVIGLALTARADVRKGEFLIAPEGSFGLPLGDYPSPAVDDIPVQVPLGEQIEPGFAISGRIERVMNASGLALGGNFGVNFNEVDEAPIQEFLNNAGLDSLRPEFSWQTVHIGGHARWYMNPEKRANPFFHVGAGLYLNKLETDLVLVRSSGTENRTERSESFTNLGVSLGPGALIRISKDVRIALEAILNNVFTDEKNVRYINFTVGMVIGVMPQQ